MDPIMAESVQEGAREWMIAAGTILAVVVALAIAGYPAMRDWLLRPDLKVEFEESDPFLRTVGQETTFRLKISNKGKRTARSCRVRVDISTSGNENDPAGLLWQRFGEKPIDIAPDEWEWVRVWHNGPGVFRIEGSSQADQNLLTVERDNVDSLRVTVYSENASHVTKELPPPDGLIGEAAPE